MITQLDPWIQYSIWVAVAAITCHIYIYNRLWSIRKSKKKYRPPSYNSNPKDYKRSSWLFAVLNTVLAAFLLLGLQAGSSFNVVFAAYIGGTLPDASGSILSKLKALNTLNTSDTTSTD